MENKIYIKWSDEYSVNIKQLDEQHNNLVNLLNKLKNYIDAKDLNKLENIINELLEYTNYHFSAEEDLMKDNGYPDYLDHKLQHKSFQKEVISYKLKLEKENPVILAQQILFFMKKWLLFHILEIDKQYSLFLNEKNIY